MSKLELVLAKHTRLRVAILCFVSSIVLAGLPHLSSGQSIQVRPTDFLPQEILDLDAGTSSAWLLERIKNSGTHSSAPVARPNRIRITWVPNKNPYYSQLDFTFTEKDRLFLVRLALNDDSRWSVNTLKKQFLDRFHISAEQPSKFRIGQNDTLVYPPGRGGQFHFFEITDMGTGKKFLELFDKDIDAQDRPPAKPAEQGGAKQEGQPPAQQPPLQQK
ncbi:MAG: hypothetical protein HY913_03030 [Desulfomonile tiedjei]|nr:hypothetical protein [Desulfomonile tiedjei]